MDLWAEVQETKASLDLALKACKERGLERSRLEAHYYSVKDRRVVELKDQGCTATEIGLRIKGEPEVNEAMQAFHDAEVGYDNAREAVNVYKKWLDFLREEYQREWSQAGRSY